jgi:Flp pilus assembly pilin Flp
MTAALHQFIRHLRGFAADQRGGIAIEYAILISMVLVALLGIATLSDVANTVNVTFERASSNMK